MEKLEVGKKYQIGKYECEIRGCSSESYLHITNDSKSDYEIFKQFGIKKEELVSLGAQSSGVFPWCSYYVLQKVYEYIMSKDPANKVLDINNTKIWIGNNPELSRKIQEKAFELGYTWVTGETNAQYLDKETIYFDNNYLSYSNGDKYYFSKHENREITPMDLGIKEFEIKPLEQEEKFVVGKWYICSQWTSIKAAKFLKTEDTRFYFSEKIQNGSHTIKSDWASGYNFEKDYKEVNLSEIQQYLPANHPDKQIPKEECKQQLGSLPVKEWDIGTYAVAINNGHANGKPSEVYEISVIFQISHKFWDETFGLKGYSNTCNKKDFKWFATKEEAEKFSLSLSSSKTIEKPNIQTMEQFKIGDWVYSECLNTGSSKGIGKITKIDKEDSRQPCLMLNIKGRGEVWSYNGYQRLATKDEIPSDTTNSSLKVNDWVVVTERYDCNYAEVGMIGQLTKTDLRHSIPYEVGNCKDFSGRSWCKNVRKAEPWEISNTIRITQEKIINSSTNVALATKGQLPLYEVKKRVVLN